MHHIRWNKYDLFLIILVASLAGGVIGGALTPTRIITILLFPHFICSFVSAKKMTIQFLLVFFAVWLIYATLSIVWTTDKAEAFNQLVYYSIHFIYFLEIVIFTQYAINPLKSIVIGWMIGFLITAQIAVWELITDNHLYTSKFSSNRSFNAGGGEFLMHRFCASTYDNYNSYVTYLCFAFPFLLYYGTVFDKRKILYVVSIVLSFVFVAWNASRGGLISVMGMLLLFLLLTKKNKVKNITLILLAFVLAFFLTESNDAITILLSRLKAVPSGNNDRILIWRAAVELWESTYFIGSGIGSMQSAMRNFSTVGIFITHNLFLEVLVEFGFFIFVPFIVGLSKMFRDSFNVNDEVRKKIILVAFVLLPVISIINSGYLLQPYTTAFFSSLYVFTYYEPNKFAN